MEQYRAGAGFTLVELLTVMAIAGVVAAIAIPTFTSSVEREQRRADTSQLVNLIGYMRSEASRNSVGAITFCSSPDINASEVKCNTDRDSNTWEKGWAVFSDLNGDGNIDGDDPLLKVGQGASESMTIRASGFSRNGRLVFDSTGSPGASGTITLCDSNGAANAMALIVSVVGASRWATKDEDGYALDHRGERVQCPS